MLPTNLAQMVFGACLAFFGGTYFAGIAAVEAARMFGGAPSAPAPMHRVRVPRCAREIDVATFSRPCDRGPPGMACCEVPRVAKAGCLHRFEAGLGRPKGSSPTSPARGLEWCGPARRRMHVSLVLRIRRRRACTGGRRWPWCQASLRRRLKLRRGYFKFGGLPGRCRESSIAVHAVAGWHLRRASPAQAARSSIRPRRRWPSTRIGGCTTERSQSALRTRSLP